MAWRRCAWQRSGGTKPFPKSVSQEAFTQAVFSLPKNGVTPIVTVGTNKLVFAQVTEIFPEHPAEFADVESQVREQVLASKISKLSNDTISSLEAKAKAGADLAALAKEVGATIKTSSLVDRMGSIEGFGLASSASEAFSKNPGEVAGPFRSGGGAFFMRVDEKVAADLTQMVAQRDQLLNELKNRRARDRRAIFTESILQSLIKNKKVKIYEDSINRLLGTFSS